MRKSNSQLYTLVNTVELRLSELIKTRGGSDKLIVRIIEQHAIHMKLDHIQCIKSTVQRGTWLFIVHYYNLKFYNLKFCLNSQCISFSFH